MLDCGVDLSAVSFWLLLYVLLGSVFVCSMLYFLHHKRFWLTLRPCDSLIVSVFSGLYRLPFESFLSLTSCQLTRRLVYFLSGKLGILGGHGLIICGFVFLFYVYFSNFTYDSGQFSHFHEYCVVFFTYYFLYFGLAPGDSSFPCCCVVIKLGLEGC